MSTPEALPCPACGSDCNERDELTKAEREIERLTALAGPSGKRLGELERINDDLIADNERLTAERDSIKETLHDELAENLRLRDLGGALPEEGMTAYIERLIAERDALRNALAEVDRLAGHDDALTEWRDRCAHFWDAQGKEPSNG